MADVKNQTGSNVNRDKDHTVKGALADHDANRDPITDAPGSHPTGTGIGSASGAAAGAALGAIGGPVGALIGGIAGAITGAGVGHGIGEYVDPTEEEAYWRSNYNKRDYYKQGKSYDEYEPAYAYGYSAYRSKPDSDFDSMEGELASSWRDRRGSSKLEWNDARPAVRDAWSRINERSKARK